MTFPDNTDTTLDQGQEVISPDTVEENKPPYAQYLEGLPTSILPQVEQAFKKWDADTSRKFQEVHSQYEPLKAYQDLASNQVNPQDALQGLILLQKLQENPQSVYEEIGKAFGFGQQGQQEPLEQDSFGEPSLSSNPEFTQMQQMTQAMAEYLVQQEDQKKQQAADAAIDSELNGLKTKYGNFDERFVVTQMLNGATGEQAVQMFQQAVNSAIQQRQQNRPGAPVVMGAGGGIPSSTVDVGKLSKRDTMSLVQQMLAQGAQEG